MKNAIADMLIQRSQKPSRAGVGPVASQLAEMRPGSDIYHTMNRQPGYQEPIDASDQYFLDELGPADAERYKRMTREQQLDFLNDPANGFVPPAPVEDPRGMFFQEDSFLPPENEVQVADASGGEGLTPERLAEEGPPPTIDQLVQMGQAAGIDPEALKGLDLNSTQARNFGYLLRMMEAESTVRGLSESNTMGQKLLEALPGQQIESFFMDPEYRRYRLARENFNEAALRAATGATINQQEMPIQRQNYFPLPTDDEETRAFLQRQRQALMMALAAGSGPGASVIPEFGNPVVRRQTDIPNKPDLSKLSDEEIAKALSQ